MKRTALRRGKPLRRKTYLRARSKTNSYRRRPRAIAYMLFVKTLRCWARIDGPGYVHAHRCAGIIEADHAGRRGVKQKCSDYLTIPLCTLAHQERDAFSGPFKTHDRAWMRDWLDAGIHHTQAIAINSGIAIPKEHRSRFA